MKLKSEPSATLVKIGKITGSKGLKGHLKIHLFAGEAAWMDSAISLFIASETIPQEYFTESLSLEKNNLIAKLKSVNDRTSADRLKGREVFIGENLLTSAPGEKVYLRELIGFNVVCDGKMIGPILDFESNGAQDLIVVEHEARRVLIPLVQSFIVRIDFSESRIYMKLPEGLLDAI